MGKLKPWEVLEFAIWKGLAASVYPKPGMVIQKLSPEQREALSELRAEDTQVRIDAVYDLPRKPRS